jgi:hypothetical protein
MLASHVRARLVGDTSGTSAGCSCQRDDENKSEADSAHHSTLSKYPGGQMLAGQARLVVIAERRLRCRSR